jgi:hypothetical protein
VPSKAKLNIDHSSFGHHVIDYHIKFHNVISNENEKLIAAAMLAFYTIEN